VRKIKTAGVRLLRAASRYCDADHRQNKNTREETGVIIICIII
jgi:hypothetical protein